jgi:hypothetical protein
VTQDRYLPPAYVLPPATPLRPPRGAENHPVLRWDQRFKSLDHVSDAICSGGSFRAPATRRVPLPAAIRRRYLTRTPVCGARPIRSGLHAEVVINLRHFFYIHFYREDICPRPGSANSAKLMARRTWNTCLQPHESF